MSLLQRPAGQVYVSQYLQRRDYAGGLVLTNPDNVSHVFLVPGHKKDLIGNRVSGKITIQSGAGVVLLNA